MFVEHDLGTICVLYMLCIFTPGKIFINMWFINRVIVNA